MSNEPITNERILHGAEVTESFLETPSEDSGHLLLPKTLPEGVDDTWMVVEAVPERLELKEDFGRSRPPRAERCRAGILGVRAS